MEGVTCFLAHLRKQQQKCTSSKKGVYIGMLGLCPSSHSYKVVGSLASTKSGLEKLRACCDTAKHSQVPYVKKTLGEAKIWKSTLTPPTPPTNN